MDKRLIYLILFLTALHAGAQQRFNLNQGWQTMAAPDSAAYQGFQSTTYRTENWQTVDVPHNWDAYDGYRRLLHGNKHGTAWYRRSFKTPALNGRRAYLFFEGVSSYASVWVNGQWAGRHAGGRTTFTLDVTDLIHEGNNLLAVRADHPANIRDLPWVCGGCSNERGFSEGSQPMGIFRPVTLILREAVHVAPFGIHAWNDAELHRSGMPVHLEMQLNNDGPSDQTVTVQTAILNQQGKQVHTSMQQLNIPAHGSRTITQAAIVNNPQLWSPSNPYLYKIQVTVQGKGRQADKTTTSFGIRTISWPLSRKDGDPRFYINGQPFFINGIAEYEHLIGSSHAFTDEQIRTRVSMVKQGGFNAFRDAHQPHNLLYQKLWDSSGILCWTQLSAHVWFDTPAFREQFKQNLREWVIERRNSPSIILWGLQNESKLPADFAKECTELIRQLDPTSPSQRLVTTCNGGEGTDWDVPQNWTGTYGGNPDTYGEDLKRQSLVGEYGAWRTVDLHTDGSFQQNGVYSEERFTALMEKKFRLGNTVSDSTTGHFMWLLTSHDNPGRVQNGEGLRDMDRIGPVNYKGLFTPWEEPTEAYYMFRAESIPASRQPIIYLAGHNWPQRWTRTGLKDSIIVYSNCDEVEIFNGGKSLGKKKRPTNSGHFQFDRLNIRSPWIKAVGYYRGKRVADSIYLPLLATTPTTAKYQNDIMASAPGYQYYYRINCGGSAMIDYNNNEWMADQHYIGQKSYGSTSWTDAFPGLPWNYASQRRSFEPVAGTYNDAFFQTFRYGREALQYHFPLTPGRYRVELYFMEPWFGRAGMNVTGWRDFDVAINGKTVLHHLDLSKEGGLNKAVKKVFNVEITGDTLTVNFPKIYSSQAVISAIAIAGQKECASGRRGMPRQSFEFLPDDRHWPSQDWLDILDPVGPANQGRFTQLPPELYGGTELFAADPKATLDLRMHDSVSLYVLTASNDSLPLPGFNRLTETAKSSAGLNFTVYKKIMAAGERFTPGPALLKNLACLVIQPLSELEPAYDFNPTITIRANQAGTQGRGIVKEEQNGKSKLTVKKAAADNAVSWSLDPGVAQKYAFTLSYHWDGEQPATGRLELRAADGSLMMSQDVQFEYTRPGKFNYINSSSGSMINAGHYTLKLLIPGAEGLIIDKLEIQ